MPQPAKLRPIKLTKYPLRHAIKSLTLAAVYAEDGAINTAIEIAEQAVLYLRKERDRRDRLLRGIFAKRGTKTCKS